MNKYIGLPGPDLVETRLFEYLARLVATLIRNDAYLSTLYFPFPVLALLSLHSLSIALFASATRALSKLKYFAARSQLAKAALT